MTLKAYPIVSRAGTKKDGSKASSNYYTDSLWMRYQRGVPRKIGGYIQITSALPNIIRDLFVIPLAPNFNIYLGDYQSLKYFVIDQLGNPIAGLTDRTPAGFVVSADNMWQTDTLFTTTSNTDNIIAHAAPNLSYIDSSVETPIYYGPTNAATPLVPTTFSCSGGIMSLNPYLVSFGNFGTVEIFAANDPTTSLNKARITNQKIVAGLPVRGGNSSPAGLLWSLNSVIRMTQIGTGGVVDFKFDTISDQSSILSSNSVVEYDSLYYWAAIDRFLVYNGVVQEVPNQLNLNYFFQNLNFVQRQKVWATKVPEFGEIWWHYPHGTATECNHAVIYNVREKTWYDTAIARSCGYYDQVYADPIWANNVASGGTYNVYSHEDGVDENINGTLTAIDCYVETSDIAWVAQGPDGAWAGTDRWVDLQRVEPDFWQQSGDITLTVKGTQYAQSTTVQSVSYTLAVDQEKQDMREQRRYMTLKFESNVVGGFFELGQLILLMSVGDARA